MINENAPELSLNIAKVSSALKKRIPNHLGPWTYTKTTLGQSNPTFVLSGKNNKLGNMIIKSFSSYEEAVSKIEEIKKRRKARKYELIKS